MQSRSYVMLCEVVYHFADNQSLILIENNKRKKWGEIDRENYPISACDYSELRNAITI